MRFLDWLGPRVGLAVMLATYACVMLWLLWFCYRLAGGG